MFTLLFVLVCFLSTRSSWFILCMLVCIFACSEIGQLENGFSVLFYCLKRQHLVSVNCVEDKREDYQNCFTL